MNADAMHKKANVEISTSPVVPCGPTFTVKALEPIQGKRSLIKLGDFVLVDPDAPCVDGRLVLIGQRLEPWCGQQGISGVATMTWSDDV